ncbi:hypothetical protein [Streptomyces sp. NPDC005374]|uniref:hypothetical protein n=1 Tax=Streptomyces sp. NPDC005374 TaxID=3364713 RepID=UPI0036C05296
MDGQNSLADVFRFAQLRPARPVRESNGVALVIGEVSQQLGDATTVDERIVLANEVLSDGERSVRNVGELALGPEILEAYGEMGSKETPTVGTLVAEISDVEALVARPEFEDDRTRLSNTLLASTYGTRDADLNLRRLALVYRLYAALRLAASGDGHNVTLAELAAIPVVGPPPSPPSAATPASLGTAIDSLPVVAGGGAKGAPAVLGNAMDAAGEIARFDVGGHLVQPDGKGRAITGSVPFTLTAAARAGLSTGTTAVLASHSIDLTKTPAYAAVSLLHDLAETPVRQPFGAHGERMLGTPGMVVARKGAVLQAGHRPRVKAVGIASLLVVKQQIKRYEAAEIAHVENVIAGERRVREHRRLERTEDIITIETERSSERENELETTDRFELNRETSRTLREDRQAGVELSLSGKYGPTVEFTSNAEMTVEQAKEESTRNATTFSKEVVQRSLERVVERVREERVRRIVQETEERNLHEMTNSTDDHHSAIYQFLDKVYEAQVFDYGIRQMFDFMVPEPASFLWFREQAPVAGPRLPVPPPRLDSYAPNAGYVDATNFRELAALYGATDVEAPPPLYVTVTAVLDHGPADGATEEGRLRSRGRLDLAVPAGYTPWHAAFTGIAMTDDLPVIAISTGWHSLLLRATAGDREVFDSAKDHKLYSFPLRLFADFSSNPVDAVADTKLAFTVIGYETNAYTVNAELVCRRREPILTQWRLTTYAKIEAAYQDRLREHQQEVADLEARQASPVSPYGASPQQNRATVRDELKKHCLTIVTGQTYDAISAPQDGAPPTFDLERAAAEGAFVRFFEHAFEWDQLQYVCYPYFWARKETWAERFGRQDADPEFRDFWRAGWARVVVPARPGFEAAIRHFLQFRTLPPSAVDPEVESETYLPIVKEISERTGRGQGELPVGDPWEVRIPTSMVLVRAGSDLPTWRRTDADSWAWTPDDAPAPATDGAAAPGTDR